MLFQNDIRSHTCNPETKGESKNRVLSKWICEISCFKIIFLVQGTSF